MLPLAILSALVLFVTITVVILRGLEYIKQHPEILTAEAPITYQRCQTTLIDVIERYKQIAGHVTHQTIIAWQSPNGRLYTVSLNGVQERAEAAAHKQVYHLGWEEIGGVGVRMQPGFRLAGYDRDGGADFQYTMGYSFNLLIVPASGSTMEIMIPTDGHPDAVDFVAHTIALADHMNRRINVFGFDKPPAPHYQKIPRF